MPRMGVHARQGFYIQPHPATGHLGRVDITNHITSPGQGLQRGVTLFYASFAPTSKMQVHLRFYSECSRNSHCKWSGSPFIYSAKLRNRRPHLFWIWYATEGKIKLPLFFLTKTLTMAKTCKDYIGIGLKTLYISIHFGTTSYQKKYMHAPRAVHACTFFRLIAAMPASSLPPGEGGGRGPLYGSPRYSNISLTW